jgi:hypothetical protein
VASKRQLVHFPLAPKAPTTRTVLTKLRRPHDVRNDSEIRDLAGAWRAHVAHDRRFKLTPELRKIAEVLNDSAPRRSSANKRRAPKFPRASAQVPASVHFGSIHEVRTPAYHYDYERTQRFGTIPPWMGVDGDKATGHLYGMVATALKECAGRATASVGTLLEPETPGTLHAVAAPAIRAELNNFSLMARSRSYVELAMQIDEYLRDGSHVGVVAETRRTLLRAEGWWYDWSEPEFNSPGYAINVTAPVRAGHRYLVSVVARAEAEGSAESGGGLRRGDAEARIEATVPWILLVVS